MTSGITYEQGARPIGRAVSIAVVLSAMSLLSCKDPVATSGERIAEIQVSPAETTVPVGTIMTLKAELKNDAGEPMSGHDVHWSSSDSTIATVAPGGVVTARSSGDVQIAATAQGVSAVASVRVSAAPPATSSSVERVRVSPASAVVRSTGEQQFRRVQLSATALDGNDREIGGRSFEWSSNKNSVATVNSSGLVTGLKTGTVTISAKTNGKTGTATIVVVK